MGLSRSNSESSELLRKILKSQRHLQAAVLPNLSYPRLSTTYSVLSSLCDKMEALSMEQMNRYASPINPAVFPHLTIVLLSIGIFFMAWFFVYEVTSTKYNRDIYKELLVSLVASLFMGFGVLFLLLWVGIYV
ncbi:transmembrane protein 258 [Acropora millepora]|nr:transmembrane protein 258 [Acropora millepora]